ncbi:fumarylacetoacetate hydrolase family protein [Mycolicibacterium sp. jd]|uniref:fumarylacetoacetate hydrolase family protein n=1 Tax=Mycolicibacterium TaxID=1866885 RepID=UPI001CA30FFF|nr:MULTISPECIES: fumarylacetoacetate hydrolase family protein [Mycolicibacterium]MDW5610511.1 fumarylacetoacetate hydrolase family protein [Mycolicibacterium sp. D5.8-2]QZT55658.1 fumarylacetoacetate hydrolase family protein [Mycolicibacterium austroafricanum]
MKLRRVIADGRLELQSLGPDGSWAPAPDPSVLGGPVFDPAWELAAAQRHHGLAGCVLPFQPASFRDFMLYEDHAIDAARGLVRRFHPAQSRAAETVEKLTRKPFPLFKPKPLFYRQPIYYMSNHLSFVPSGAPVAFPSYSTALDFELELGFVLNAPLFNASSAEAVDAVGAFVVVNDFSARDVQRAEMATGLGPQKAKHFVSSMSAVAVTADEILPILESLSGSVTINGRTVSTVSSAGPQWTIGDMLAHASRDEKLYPGELFATGTLPGGSGMETGHWLRPGDRITLSIEQVGEISHQITS